VIGIVGELLITAGVLVFLFLGWQLWLNDLIVGTDQNNVGTALGESWVGGVPAHQHTTVDASFGEPVVAIAPANAVQFAVMYVPRFGPDYARSISEGVETAKVAAHRTTHGAPFKALATLQVGDKIYVQTQDGYYTYNFRGLEYVRPTGVGVLDPVPQFAGVAPTDRFLTMTSCNPMFSASERIIAYAALDSWQPISAGAPAAIAAALTAKS